MIVDIEVDIEVGEKNVDGGCAVVLFFARALVEMALEHGQEGQPGRKATKQGTGRFAWMR